MGGDIGLASVLGKHNGAILKQNKALKESQRGSSLMGLAEGKGPLNPAWQLVNKRALSTLITNSEGLPMPSLMPPVTLN